MEELAINKSTQGLCIQFKMVARRTKNIPTSSTKNEIYLTDAIERLQHSEKQAHWCSQIPLNVLVLMTAGL